MGRHLNGEVSVTIAGVEVILPAEESDDAPRVNVEVLTAAEYIEDEFWSMDHGE